MSLYDRLKAKRHQKRANDRLERHLLREEEARKRREGDLIELSLIDQIKETAIDNDVKLSLKPLMIDEDSNDYDERSTVIKLPVTQESVDKFKVLCDFSSQVSKYMSGVSVRAGVPDVPIHLFPVLECALILEDPENKGFPVRQKREVHPMMVIDRSESGSEHSTSESSLLTSSVGSVPQQPPSTSSPSSSLSSSFLLYLRVASGTRDDQSSWGTLESSLLEGRWVSEKLIVKWSVQLMRTLWQLHSQFVTFGSLYSKDVCLVSDDTVVALNDAKNVYVKVTEERAMAMNLYNKHFEGVYIRTSAMLDRLKLEREGIIRKKKLLERQKSGAFYEDPGDGVGGLIDAVPPSADMFAHLDRGDSPPDRESMRKLFMSNEPSERDFILTSINGKSRTNAPWKLQNMGPEVMPEAANRKDAWIKMPFDEEMAVKYTTASEPFADMDDVTSIGSDMFSYSTTTSVSSLMPGGEGMFSSPKLQKSIIGDNRQLKIEHIPKLKAVDASSHGSQSEKATQKVLNPNLPDLEKYTTPVVDKYAKVRPCVKHSKLFNRVPKPSPQQKKKLSTLVVPIKR